MRRLAIVAALFAALPGRGLPAEDHPGLQGVRRVVVLGDSITYSGQYVEDIAAYLRLRDPAAEIEFLDLGLPSETVSGLSEPGHAGGQFPRPDLHERLGRVLERTKPDLLVCCYGMNDGIYYPFGEDRFEAFQAGMRRLRERAGAAGARVLHVTPPPFDPGPIRDRTLPAGRDEYRQPFEGYDDVLARYSAWLLDRRADGWDVVDVHGPLRAYLDARRDREPGFRLAADGVHLDDLGHWLMAREILTHWGYEVPPPEEAPSVEAALADAPHGEEVLRLVRRRQRKLKDAWLTAVGHRRPGMAAGPPLEEARREAGAIDAEIRDLLGRKP